MRKMSVFSISLLSGALLLMAGCASKPDQAVTSAQQQQTQARAAEADVYAADLYKKGQEALDAAQAEIQAQDAKFALSRDYSKAEALLNEAATTMEQAASAAATNKEAARAQAEAALTQAEEALASAEKALQTAPRGKDTRADLEAMNSDLAAAKAALGEARQAFQASNYADANSKLDAVIATAQEISSDVEEAKAKRRGRRGGSI